MSAEWIRPAGCESGSCVEYRTVGDKVFVRNSSDHVGEEMLEFTVAEWDTFVVGLTTVRLTAVEDERDFHAAHAERIATIADTIAVANRRKREANAALAGENARLRTELAITTDQLRDSRAMCDGHVDPRDLDKALRQRNAAIAKVEVLRHRDRRTQAVVRGLSAWVAQMRDLDLDQTAMDILGDDLVAAVDAYEKGPTEPPESPLPAEQPPDVAA